MKPAKVMPAGRRELDAQTRGFRFDNGRQYRTAIQITGGMKSES
jgi:hypothetical protein